MFVRFDDLEIMKAGNYNLVPVDCPVCGTMLKHSDIRVAYTKCGCCEECSFSFFESNQEKWKAGWRPSPEEVNRVLKNRSKLPTYIMRG